MRLNFGKGFTVISGRNGVGKSTIFDAIEFALTGQIDKYRIEKAAKESLLDYVWWRGSGQATAHYVSVGFDDDGHPFSVTRTRESGADKTVDQIEAVLCRAAKPDQALRQLCRTSIIRDELIAALSVDLSETERFDLVRTALGAIEASGYASKAKEVVAAAESTLQQAQRRFEEDKMLLNAELIQLSQSRDRASKAGDVSAAISLINSLLGPRPGGLVEQIAAARERLARGRTHIATLAEEAREAHEIARRSAELDSPEYRRARESAKHAAEDARSRELEARNSLELAKLNLQKEKEADAIATALAELVRHGEYLGLSDGHCPLCAAERTPREFEAGIELARARISQRGAQTLDAQAQLEEAEERLTAAVQALTLAQQVLENFTAAENALTARRDAQLQRLEKLGIEETFQNVPDEFEEVINAAREQLLELEQAILTLEASQAVEMLTNIETRVESIRARVADSENAVVRAQRALNLAKTIQHSVLRTSAEIVDERLALLSPLLGELYARLRPHADWRSIEYSIRGDVRRFLSLRVGDGLNPQFVFSSGQRRAVGLAFLLSVYLARPWSRWQTLLLDDPVQHVDDFRALHLVELLAALRLHNRQIVCAVEDPDLADLLCRRLISTADAPGIRYELGYTTAGNIEILASSEVLPLPSRTIGRAADARTG